MQEKNSFLRALQQKHSVCDSATPGKDASGKKQTEADAMMAEIQKGIKFFNEKDEQDESIVLRQSERQQVDESMRLGNCALANMSFSFAVEAPVEMEHQHKLIGQGWKKANSNETKEGQMNKRQAKQKEKELVQGVKKEEQISEKIKKLVCEVGQKVCETGRSQRDQQESVQPSQSEFTEPQPRYSGASSSNCDKYVEQMYQKTIEKHQDLNVTGKELAMINSKEKGQLSTNKTKKRMTEAQPFEFETHKRAKFTEDLHQNDMVSEMEGVEASKSEQKGYVPLWQQVKESFQLRPDDESKDIARLENMLNPQSGTQSVQMKITKPVAPNLATEERSQLNNLDGRSQETIEPESSNFKAKPLNKKIFERPSKLPEVPKKEKTDFAEFSLSQTNKKAAQQEQQNLEFKALPLNKKMLQEPTFRPNTIAEERAPTDAKPFDLKTEERSKSKKPVEEEEAVGFKAREMPNYRFFEPKKEPKEGEQIQFQEFNLHTKQRKELTVNTTRKMATQPESAGHFKARPMPDFNTPGLQSAGAVCSLKSLTKAQPFNLTTETRGAEKKAKLDSAYQIKDESGTFKAREMPDFDNSARNLSVSPLRAKPSALADKAPVLASDARSLLRQEFNIKMKEINEKKAQETEQLRADKLRQAEEEDELAKASTHFKATPIRRYKPIDSSHIPSKELTCPVQMELHTQKRGQMRNVES